MTRPYALLADLHAHDWNAFSTTNENGVNSRLIAIMDELGRAAKTLLGAGGNTLVIAGDLFHQRGSIDPEVFNYVHGFIRATIATYSIDIIALPGNHDLKGRETTDLGNAFKSLAEIDGFHVASAVGGERMDRSTVSEAQYAVLVPWHSTKEGLLSAIEDWKDKYKALDLSDVDLIIHWGIDGVLEGMPDHGTSPAELEALGFKRVFAGHYHNHKVFPGGKVVSIGATTHQKWNDIGSRAGFLIVHGDRIEFHGSHAPSFVEINGDTDPDDIPLIVDGNFVRVASMKMTDAQINQMRGELTDMGAKGVVFQVTRETVSARTGEAMKAKTLGEAVGDYVGTLGLPEPAPVAALCQVILEEAQIAAD